MKFNLAEAYQRNGQYKDAAVCLEKLWNKDPNQPGLRDQLAKAYQLCGDSVEAMAALDINTKPIVDYPDDNGSDYNSFEEIQSSIFDSTKYKSVSEVKIY